MPMIRKEDALSMSRNAIVLDLGDLQRQGDAIVEQAKHKADEIVESAKRQRDRLLEGAAQYGRTEGYGKGMSEGHAEGLAEGRSEAIAQLAPEIAVLIDRWTEALDMFETERLLLLNQASDKVVEFAVEFAQRVTKRTIALDKEAACAQLDAALAMLLNPSRVVILVHTEDRDVIDDALPELLAKFGEIKHAELLTDDSLTRGSCVIRSGAEEVDADIQRQMDRLVETVLPAPAAQEPAQGTAQPLDDAA